jgi:hypothetical protein
LPASAARRMNVVVALVACPRDIEAASDLVSENLSRRAELGESAEVAGDHSDLAVHIIVRPGG